MKINKKTIIICSIVIIISGITIIGIEAFALHFDKYELVQTIFLGIFTGFIVSLVNSIIQYFHEKNSIIEKTDNNIRSLYINMYVLSRIIGNALQQIHTTLDLSRLPFNNISGLSALNVDFLNKMNLGLFSPFCKNGEQNKVYRHLIKFQSIAYNMKNIADNLQISVLEYTNQLLKKQNDELLEKEIDSKIIQNLDELKNFINIRTAKFHEYTTSKVIELEEIAKEFYQCKNNEQSWEDIKAMLMLEVDDIVRK